MNLWRNPSSNITTQHKDLSGELQVTIQKVIDMIDSSTAEETIGDDIVQEETIGDDIVQEETRGDDWFDWLV